jgi:PiT family inorganic phosphate transporter
MFGLGETLTIVLILCIICACAFEFINGFHDTANAVATVIYTHSLPPVTAVIWSGIWNSIGVFFGGIAVAMSIVNLLPPETLINQEMAQNISMILSLLFSAILWNLGTWKMGLPVSSSHTMIGSILGVGIAFSLLQGNGLNAVNWDKAANIGLSLLISPLLGFGLTLMVMLILKRYVKDQDFFKAPKGKKPPRPLIRSLLVLSCTSVSYAHGSNDGQKGIGLMMLILISIAPFSFAIDRSKDIYQLERPTELVLGKAMLLDDVRLNPIDRAIVDQVKAELFDLKQVFDRHRLEKSIPEGEFFNMRKDILFISKHFSQLKKSGALKTLQKDDLKEADKAVGEMKKFTEYVPFWVVLIISLSLGLGTMIGWKRIVVTIGEKIGKEHLSYAQGASAELVAASTIGLASISGLPVSTTQVLSSGVAGSMVSSNGIKNLQAQTVRNIAIAWLLTLPVTALLSGGIYTLLRLFL